MYNQKGRILAAGELGRLQ